MVDYLEIQIFMVNDPEKPNRNSQQQQYQHNWVYNFSVSYAIIDISDIVDIHRYFMKNHNIV